MGAAAGRLGFSPKYEGLFAECRQEATKSTSVLLFSLLALCWSVNILPVFAQQRRSSSLDLPRLAALGCLYASLTAFSCRMAWRISVASRNEAVAMEVAKAEALLCTMAGATVNALLLRPGELDLVGTMPWCRVAAINAFFFSFLGVRAAVAGRIHRLTTLLYIPIGIRFWRQGASGWAVAADAAAYLAIVLIVLPTCMALAEARIRLDFVRKEELCPSELEPFWHTVAYGCPPSDSWAEARRRPQDARSVLRGILAAASAVRAVPGSNGGRRVTDTR